MAEAAAALGYVPSAVSQHIAALERDMGIELVVRRPGSRLILTAAGRSLAQATETLFDATARFQDAANGISNHVIAELRVGAYPSAMSHLLPAILSALKPRGRGPRIRLIIVETDKGLPKVKSGDLDLLIAYRYLPEDPPADSGEWTITPWGTSRWSSSRAHGRAVARWNWRNALRWNGPRATHTAPIGVCCIAGPENWGSLPTSRWKPRTCTACWP